MTLHVPADTPIAPCCHAALCFLLPMWRCCCALYATVTALRRGLQQIKAGRAAQLHGQMSIQVAVWTILEGWNISIVDFPRCDTTYAARFPPVRQLQLAITVDWRSVSFTRMSWIYSDSIIILTTSASFSRSFKSFRL